MGTDYIIPTKKNPVFIAVCTDFGYIETGMYKNWNIKKEGIINQVGDTFACDYAYAIQRIHEWIKEDPAYIKSLGNKIVFRIECVDGTLDRFNDVIYKTVYFLTATKAKKYLL